MHTFHLSIVHKVKRALSSLPPLGILQHEVLLKIFSKNIYVQSLEENFSLVHAHTFNCSEEHQKSF